MSFFLIVVIIAVWIALWWRRNHSPRAESSPRRRVRSTSPARLRPALEQPVNSSNELASAYLSTVDPIRNAKREDRFDDALRLCLTALEATERESQLHGCGVAPWYYEQAAIVSRKLRDRDGEIQILRRFAAQKHAPGVKPAKLLERLRKLESAGQ